MTDDEIMAMAEAAQGEFTRRRRTMEDFRYDEQQRAFWDLTTGMLMHAESVNGAIPRDLWPTRENADGEEVPFAPAKAINDVDTGLTVETSTWWPGKPQIIRDLLVSDRGAEKRPGAQVYNSYRPPQREEPPEGVDAQKWIDHVKWLWPDPEVHEHFFDFCAHAIQRPDEKVNHGIVISGQQGIGKDTALVPIREGVGEWNTCEIGPDDVTQKFNDFVRSVLIVINEVRPVEHEQKASDFYNRLKPLLAAPPSVLPVEVKYMKRVHIQNVCHVVMTTNDLLEMYVPEVDRRLFIMHSKVPAPKGMAAYFRDLWRYLKSGGSAAVIRWLEDRDLSNFDASEAAPSTEAKKKVIDVSTFVRESEVEHVVRRYIEHFGEEPPIIFAADLLAFVQQTEFDDREDALRALKSKSVPYRMDRMGYSKIPTKGAWRHKGFYTRSAYARSDIDEEEAAKLAMDEIKKRPLTFEVS